MRQVTVFTGSFTTSHRSIDPASPFTVEVTRACRSVCVVSTGRPRSQAGVPAVCVHASGCPFRVIPFARAHSIVSDIRGHCGRPGTGS